MPTLNDYAAQTQALLHDPTASLYGSLTTYINEARMRLALQSECVRFLYGADGISFTGTFSTSLSSITSVTPDPQGITDTLTGWNIIGRGAAPGTVVRSLSTNTFTMNDQNGNLVNGAQTGAFSFIVSPPNNTAVQKESYPYLLGKNLCTTTGYANIIQTKGVAVNWGGFGGSSLVTLEQWSWTKYQAFLGYYGVNLQGNPAVWCSYQNTVRMRPVPSSIWPMQWDTVCTPIPLASNTDVEAIPYPYTDSVKYYAAYLAYMNSQTPEKADRMASLYEKTMNEARSFTQRTFVPYVYR